MKGTLNTIFFILILGLFPSLLLIANYALFDYTSHHSNVILLIGSIVLWVLSCLLIGFGLFALIAYTILGSRNEKV